MFMNKLIMNVLNSLACLVFFVLLETNAHAEKLKIKCKDGWWNLELHNAETNKLFIPRVGNVIFQFEDNKKIRWSSDFNEGFIDIFSGIAKVTRSIYGNVLGETFYCDITLIQSSDIR